MDIPAPPPEPGPASHLEMRVTRLEHEVAQLKRSMTNSPKFLPRAFAMLGHYLVAVLIIYAGVLAVVLVVMAIAAVGQS